MVIPALRDTIKDTKKVAPIGAMDALRMPGKSHGHDDLEAHHQ
jgi:hypothetical protein